MAATPASPPTIAEEDEEKGEKEDLSNHFLAIGFQGPDRVVFFSNVYDSILGKTVEALQRSRLLQLEDVEPKANTNIARIAFKTRRENPFGEGKTLESRLEHVSRVCLLLDLLATIGWRVAASGSFMQERFKSTVIFSLGRPGQCHFGCSVEDGAARRYIIVPKAFHLDRAYAGMDRRSKRFLSPRGVTDLEYAERGNFYTLRCLSHGHRETRDLAASNYLGLISALRRAGLEVVGTFNPFGDRVDSVVFCHQPGHVPGGLPSGQQPLFWGLGLSAPNPALVSESSSSAPATAAASSPQGTTSSSFSSSVRRRSSGFKLDFSSSSSSYDVNPAAASASADVDVVDCACAEDSPSSFSSSSILSHGPLFACGGPSDHLDDAENPFRFRFFGDPPGARAFVLRSALELLGWDQNGHQGHSSSSSSSSSFSSPSSWSSSGGADVWHHKSAAGKIVAAHVVKELLSCGWRLRLSINGIFNHSLLVFGRDLGFNNNSNVDLLHLSVLSNKKLCVGMVPGSETKGREAALVQSKLGLDVLDLVRPLSGSISGRKGSIRGVGKKASIKGRKRSGGELSAAMKAAEAGASAAAVTEEGADPTVIRFPPMTFNSNRQGGFEVIFRVVSGLWHHGWRLEAATNVSGLRPPTGASGDGERKHSWTHTLFMRRVQTAGLSPPPAAGAVGTARQPRIYLYPTEEDADHKNQNHA